MELEGKITKIFDTMTFDSGFQKREFVVTTLEDQYPQQIKFEFIKDRCSTLDGYAVDDLVKVQFNIKGREYNGNYFVNLQAWRMEKSGDSVATNQPPVENAPFPTDVDSLTSDEAEDDLPF